ncbi:MULTISPECIES: hypothetical protein [Flavobacterium]|nr:hypothetical protein [uncultured Flavobacterium sp.]
MNAIKNVVAPFSTVITYKNIFKAPTKELMILAFAPAVKNKK